MILNPVTKAILERRSVRKYQPRQLTEEELETILYCGILAPSANNSQPWHFCVVQDAALLDEIAADFKQRAAESDDPWLNDVAKREQYHLFFHAPTVIVVCTRDRANINPALAVESMVLAAQSLGLGSVILGLPNRVFDGPNGASFQQRLRVPEGMTPQLCVSFGVPDEQPEARPRRYDVITR